MPAPLGRVPREGLISPAVEGLDYYGERHPAGEVGGDFLDFLAMPGRGLAVTVGQVCGFGANPAVMVSGIEAQLRGHAARESRKLGSIVQQVNRTICERSPDSFYATLFCAWLDPFAHQLRYVNAGHEPALLIRRRQERVRRLEATGTVLGLTSRSTYGQHAMALEAGDILAVFTEGITEAADDRGRLFSAQGVVRTVRQTAMASPVTLARQILEAASLHSGSMIQLADQTVAIVRFADSRGEAVPAEESAELAFAAA